MQNGNKIDKSIEIEASPEKVWDVLTNAGLARILGNEIDKNAYLQSEWRPGSAVYFKYEPDKTVAQGIIIEYELHKLILVDYKEANCSDRYSLTDKGGITNLRIQTGPYPNDYQEQLPVWERWLMKVKELSEAV
jgi:uncharacterized protein YndB with AHSA1/START domain